MSVSNGGILSCYEFGMFWNRKVHVGFSTGWCVHTQSESETRALHHPPITTAPTEEKKHVISFAGSYMHNTQILCSLCKFLSALSTCFIFLVCAGDLFSFGRSTTVPLSFMHCQHPCLAFMNHTPHTHTLSPETKWRKRRSERKKGHNNKLMFNVSPENLLHTVCKVEK